MHNEMCSALHKQKRCMGYVFYRFQYVLMKCIYLKINVDVMFFYFFAFFIEFKS